MIVHTEHEKQYLIRRGIYAHYIQVLRHSEVGPYLTRRLASMPRVPVQQLEFDFGEGFDDWCYEDDVLRIAVRSFNYSDFGVDIYADDLCDDINDYEVPF